MLLPRRLALGLPLLAFPNLCPAQVLTEASDQFFTTSDRVHLHYLEAGPPTAHTVVFIPGWTMPAWIFAPQIAAFRDRYRVIAFDPRGQGDSEVAPSGYEPRRRAQDIAELLARLGPRPVLLAGWSLGVLDALAYVQMHGDNDVAGLVLIDNSIGEPPGPLPHPHPYHPGPPMPHAAYMAMFVRTMFHTPQDERWLQTLTQTTLRTPDWAARLLLRYPESRAYWRAVIESTRKPVLYAVRPWLAAQAASLERGRPNVETAIFRDSGHALFIDDAARFNALMQNFIQEMVWPKEAPRS
jgi:non-heme chloroperoxidase